MTILPRLDSIGQSEGIIRTFYFYCLFIIFYKAMHPILFKIGSLNFYTHGLLAGVGIAAAAILLYFLAKKEKLDPAHLYDWLLLSIFLGLIGAKLTYFLLYHDQFSSFWELFQIWRGGMVSYGGFVFGGLAFFLILRLVRQPILRWLDLAAIAFPLGLMLGRIGNIFAGDIEGIPLDSILSINGFLSVPSIESIFLLLLFVLLLVNYDKLKKDEGLIFFTMTIVYAFARFLIDFGRAGERVLLNLSTGQVFGLFLAVSAFIYYYFIIKRKEKYGFKTGNN